MIESVCTDPIVITPFLPCNFSVFLANIGEFLVQIALFLFQFTIYSPRFSVCNIKVLR